LIIPLLLTGCVSNSKLEPATSDMVLEYTSSVNGGSIEEVNNYYYIRVYADKRLIEGYANLDGFKEINLTDSQYQELIDLAFTKKFKKMGSDISDKHILDGSSQHITLFYADGTTFKTGGLNPTNKQFKNVVEKLNSFIK
jgi:hypothetical protein